MHPLRELLNEASLDVYGSYYQHLFRASLNLELKEGPLDKYHRQK